MSEKELNDLLRIFPLEEASGPVARVIHDYNDLRQAAREMVTTLKQIAYPAIFPWYEHEMKNLEALLTAKME